MRVCRARMSQKVSVWKVWVGREGLVMGGLGRVLLLLLGVVRVGKVGMCSQMPGMSTVLDGPAGVFLRVWRHGCALIQVLIRRARAKGPD